MGANAQTSVWTFTAGQTLTAAQMNDTARTGVPVFATTTDRDAAFGGTGEKTLAEGQMCYIEAAPKRFQVYNGTAWLDYFTSYATWTPTITASTGTLTTVTVNAAKYAQYGKLVVGRVDFTITTIGTGSGVPIFTLPITSANYVAAGAYGFYRETDNTGLTGVMAYFSTTQAYLFRYDNANHLAANNRYVGSFTYEAA